MRSAKLRLSVFARSMPIASRYVSLHFCLPDSFFCKIRLSSSQASFGLSPLISSTDSFCPSNQQVICEKVEKSDIATIDKKKYLVPADLTVGQFVYVIRKRIKLSPEKAIFIFVDEVLPPTAAIMSSIYEEHKDDDGFLYITYV